MSNVCLNPHRVDKSMLCSDEFEYNLYEHGDDYYCFINYLWQYNKARVCCPYFILECTCESEATGPKLLNLTNEQVIEIARKLAVSQEKIYHDATKAKARLRGLRELTEEELREIADRTAKNQIAIYDAAVKAKRAMERITDDE